LKQSVRAGTLVVHGDGSQTRGYVFVDDVVRCMVSAATAPGISHMIINVGSGVETSVRELVRLVLEVTGGRPELIYNPRTHPGVSRMRADLSLAHEKLGFHPQISLIEGLRLTLERDPRYRKEQTKPLRPV
jgi:UDP-glucose 4-epimerase